MARSWDRISAAHLQMKTSQGDELQDEEGGGEATIIKSGMWDGHLRMKAGYFAEVDWMKSQ